jgi:hypothetical protein
LTLDKWHRRTAVQHAELEREADPEGEAIRIASVGRLSEIQCANRAPRHLSVLGVVCPSEPPRQRMAPPPACRMPGTEPSCIARAADFVAKAVSRCYQLSCESEDFTAGRLSLMVVSRSAGSGISVTDLVRSSTECRWRYWLDTPRAPRRSAARTPAGRRRSSGRSA